ncbi:UDP-glucose 4-epimerase [Methanocella sp. CWC-04]|uniref:UDP-glucose 4-epimerase n=1 Tax=Methanooceanicella nereidis TaxID=2052831 RepID=A0AAP2RAA3_9EURY|nr:NAD-dependent epimerase/dehydratase family protein [Methanocella sp. CWC-04]MCD1293821.1 UDP-glucose 4-epimerase [Methanocella sp. CWC-04]
MKSIVTGGAGFIGSHLVDKLIRRGDDVTVIDNLSGGNIEFIKPHITNGKIRFVQANLLDSQKFQDEFAGAGFVYHLAANPDVKIGASDTRTHLDNNILATYNVLEAMRKNDVRNIAFTSTSTVYGEASIVPTPEHYGPLIPISLYGASKLASEAIICSYSHTFDMNSYIYRFANIIGDRGTHGVIFDFINKLNRDPEKLEILGNGKQSKSYLHISDCVDGMLYAIDNSKEKVNIFNIGSEDKIDVTSIAKIVAAEMGLDKVRFEYTGGDRGWKGDVPFMALSIEKMKSAGWRPTHNSEESVRLTVRSLLKEL